MRGKTRGITGWTIAVAALVLMAAGATAALAQVSVDVQVDGILAPGRTITLTAVVDLDDGSTVQSVAWNQVGGLDVTIAAPNAMSTNIVLPNRREYREYLVHVHEEPPVTADQLPENVPFPEGEFHGGTPDRFQVLGVNPFGLEHAGLLTVRLTVVTTSGTYRTMEEIHLDLPWYWSTGLHNVPINQSVVLVGQSQDTYQWRVKTRPPGSTARLGDNDTRTPEIFPDVGGLYEIVVNDAAMGGNRTIALYAGTYNGIIVGQDNDGLPLTDPVCNSCHGVLGIAADQFEPWSQTGHARIFSDQLDTGTHYGPNCFSCHTVGFDPDRDNEGADEASDYQAFLAAGLLNNPGDNWTTVLDQFPEFAMKANIQCENCHGPADDGSGFNDTVAHGYQPDIIGEPRVSLSSDVCATCHGEPLRHARFQQWQLSGHANYELAVDEGTSGSCARCHTVNGFLAWLPVLTGEVPGDPLDNVDVTWAEDESHPITCVTCHDPHAPGTTSGANTDSTTRISGDTPPLIAGFQVLAAGDGAICMTCHNSRRGLFNDQTFAESLLPNPDREPHGSSQGDVMMGENAFGVETGIRGRHSFLTDTCVTCHMQATPPPDILSYNQGGTNHTFFASRDICATCHTGIESSDSLATVVDAVSAHVEELMEARLLALMKELVMAGNTLEIGSSTVTSPSQVISVDWGYDQDGNGISSRGRQAFYVTLGGGNVVGPERITSITVVQPAPMGEAELADFMTEGELGAGWNWWLVQNDGSHGAHNPTWTLRVLDAARDALGGVGGPRAEVPFTMTEIGLKK